jgi:anti-anti-sigma factor
MTEELATALLDVAVVDGLATISGELELSTAPVVASWLASLPDPLHLDLRGVTFMDSVGLRTLLLARRHNPTMRVVAFSAAVARLLAITGLTGYLGDDPDNA